MKDIIFYIIAFAAVIALVAVILKTSRYREQADFDERQMMLRLRAFRTAFVVILIYSGFFGMLGMLLDRSLFQAGVFELSIVFVGVAVFGCMSVWNDAFFTRRGPKNYVAVLIFVIAAQMFGAIGNLMDGTVIVDRQIGEGAIQLMCAAAFAAILISILVKRVSDREEAA